MIIFTDASYSSQTKVSGYGFVIVDKKFNYKAGNFSFKPKDNNVGEVAAIAEALEYSERNKIFERTDDKTLTIISDSASAVSRILCNKEGVDEFEQERLNTIHRILNKCKLKTTIFQIKGHNLTDNTKFSYYNEVCDAIAGDYRYLGEIEKTKMQQATFVYGKNKKKGRK